MKIISDYRDYYDSTHIYGVSGDEPLFIRKKQVIEYKGWSAPYSTYNFGLGSHNSVYGDRHQVFRCITIGFCGKLYFALEVDAGLSVPKVYLYTKEAVIKYINGLDKKLIDEFHRKPGRKRDGQSKFQSLNAWYKVLEEKRHEWTKRLDPNVAIFVGESTYDYYTVTVNQWLKPYEFMKVMPHQQAYQELSMFLSNIAVPLKPIPAISNADMIEAKGFNKRFSFRKDKQT